ncbi:MAG: CPBP family intramembrane metalloprotease [Candidatus Thorarchaeota archaeon]|nr:MAG: CPBP family intramembrane metalloprotease [Candidatus Thorarchaeota archaeon]
MENEPSKDSSDQISTVGKEDSFKKSLNGLLLVLFTACSFLVINVGGYNNFIPTDMKLLARVLVVGVLLVATLILYRTEGAWKRYWRLSFSFLLSSIGLLLAWFFGRWYELIPGLTTSTVEGIAVAKLAEVLPIISTILVGMWLVERDFTQIFLRGGDLKKTFKLGLLLSPIALIPFIALGGLGLSAGIDEIVSWMPWMCVFAFSNAFMEELMVRGIFLKKYDSLFGQRVSLLLTSVIFAILHQAIIQYTDPITFSIFMGITFILGLSWGYIMQKSDNIWGAVLAHAIADILFILTVFGT